MLMLLVLPAQKLLLEGISREKGVKIGYVLVLHRIRRKLHIDPIRRCGT